MGREEQELGQTRLQIARRKEMLGKKELTVMEWAKRNMHEREKAEKENGELEGKRAEQEKEEEELDEKVKRERRREVDELAKKAKTVEGKREMLRQMRREEEQVRKECGRMEQEIAGMD